MLLPIISLNIDRVVEIKSTSTSSLMAIARISMGRPLRNEVSRLIFVSIWPNISKILHVRLNILSGKSICLSIFHFHDKVEITSEIGAAIGTSVFYLKPIAPARKTSLMLAWSTQELIMLIHAQVASFLKML